MACPWLCQSFDEMSVIRLSCGSAMIGLTTFMLCTSFIGMAQCGHMSTRGGSDVRLLFSACIILENIYLYIFSFALLLSLWYVCMLG